MAKIPGYLFLILGLIVSIASSVINKKELTIFVYIGYLFIAYGAAKILISLILKNEKHDNKEKQLQVPEAVRNNPQLRKEYQQKFGKIAKDMQGYVGYCPSCGTPMRGINIFCHRCGRRLQ